MPAGRPTVPESFCFVGIYAQYSVYADPGKAIEAASICDHSSCENSRSHGTFLCGTISLEPAAPGEYKWPDAQVKCSIAFPPCSEYRREAARNHPCFFSFHSSSALAAQAMDAS